MSLLYIRLENQIVDFFMKLYTIAKFGALLGKLILFDPPWVWGGVKSSSWSSKHIVLEFVLELY